MGRWRRCFPASTRASASCCTRGSASRTACWCARETERAPLPSAIVPPRDELVEIDRAVAVVVDRIESDARLVARAVRIEALQHLHELVELDPSVAVRVVVVEAFFELLELLGRRHRCSFTIGGCAPGF